MAKGFLPVAGFLTRLLIAGVVGAGLASAGYSEQAGRSLRSTTNGAKTPGADRKSAALATTAPLRTNPLLPLPVAVEGFFADLTLVQKGPGGIPAGFEPLCAAQEWQAFEERYGKEAEGVTRSKASGQLAFASKLIQAAGESSGQVTPGLRRLMLIRAVAIAYRSREGFATANKAVAAYLAVMEKQIPAQVGALWTIANAISRTSVTPKAERIRYDGIAAKANMQLAMLMLEADQVEAAQGIIRQIAYHEGWLKGDAATRGLIATVRARVKQTAGMMDYLATQYEPAIRNDENALLMVYLYGRYVKENVSIVADLPGRVPKSALARLAASLDAAGRSDSGTGSGLGNPTAAFAAAENLRAAAGGVPDSLLRQRVLYGVLQLYSTFLGSPLTERDRVHRTLARIAREGVIADGARKETVIDPFAVEAIPATAPADILATPLVQSGS